MLFISVYQQSNQWLFSPLSLTLFEGETISVFEEAPKLGQVNVKGNEDVLALQADIDKSVAEDGLTVTALKQGDAKMTVEMGDLPIKQVDIKVLPDIKVIPGGQSIGVKLNTEGVLVVGHHLVHAEGGDRSPGEMSGIHVGDMITKINGHTIEKMAQVAAFVQEAGKQNKELTIEVKRNQQIMTKTLLPLKSKYEQTYRMGLYIRDSAAGVGTLTFYDKKSKKYGALGHVISDVDTQKPIVVHDGRIVRSSVNSIEKGSNGDPGEKLASFKNQQAILGNIKKNSSFGIFGELQGSLLKNGVYDEEMPIALSHQVEEGPATILTVVEGEKVQEYDIEVISSTPQKFPATKGLVIKVTDPRLLKETGGIIQGMSGSPIIQNGKIIGAVTHVFVNDPTSGYGCHIEWMLEEAGIQIESEDNQKAS